MKLKHILTIVAVLSLGTVKAQEALDNFFLSYGSSLYLDIVKTPLRTTQVFLGTNPDGTKAYGDATSQSVQISTFSFGLEPRYNVHTISDDAAIAVAVPISFGIGYAGSTRADLRGIQGLGSIQIPVLARLYYGHSSTYETEKDFGVSIGGGLEYNQIGLIGGDIEDKEDGLHKGFVLPVMSVGFHFWRGNSPFEINVKYGTTKVEEYRLDGVGQPLRDETGELITRSARGSSFKVSFLYLLNY